MGLMLHSIIFLVCQSSSDIAVQTGVMFFGAGEMKNESSLRPAGVKNDSYGLSIEGCFYYYRISLRL